ncbi:carboxypeptidase-like regulatory domain-containing protein [Nannocystis sp. SCPEA4]|uniref:carboxypeptidase-like regulatory domain-containing protein n=1 Tax=Nannocystis sp. SCPEA4 TaxID=2996787 RepID=UPI00227104C7|nr:carboxypeptidase-like regulatory domain-containing protein [Nannocystis sp. SCPEA4]MCY1060330.1 carboxypeptidase-like regulatory domain-containing protein [Nannocystis sp. SCPEA4]
MGLRAWVVGVVGFGFAACVAGGTFGPRPRADITVEPAGPGVRGGVVRGVVRDMRTNEPIADELVLVFGSCLPEGRMGITDAIGVYAIHELPPGEYTLQVGSNQAEFRFALSAGARARADAYINTRSPWQ